jgi:ribosomal protein L11 methyltransferase
MEHCEVILEGLHPTTASCLEALQWLAERRSFARVLDMGCGGGMLSVMAAHWFGAQVVAADISAKAVADTQALADSRGLAQIRAVRSDGFSAQTPGPYDLILFNLLAEPITRMAPALKAHLAPGGVCVLSGMLSWLEADVEAMYAGLGFTLLHRVSRQPWQTHVWALAV